MSFTGKILDGKVILPPGIGLPDGMEVTVVASSPVSDLSGATSAEDGETLADAFSDFIGILDDLPSDFAENHDHYIHGAPKKPVK